MGKLGEKICEPKLNARSALSSTGLRSMEWIAEEIALGEQTSTDAEGSKFLACE
jgi:hypothetical protein